MSAEDWAKVAWSGGQKMNFSAVNDPSITVVAPPRPVASATAPPPPESEWAAVPTMDEQELARLLLGKGENQWPSEHLATVCARIEEMIDSKIGTK